MVAKKFQICVSEDGVMSASKKGYNYMGGNNNPDNKYIIPNIGNTWTMIDDMVLCYTAEDDYSLKWLLDGYYRAYPQTIPTNITNGGEDTIQINNVNATV